MRIAINTRFLLKKRLEGIGWFTYEVAKWMVTQHPEHEFIFFFDRPYDDSFIFGKNVTPVVLSPPARHPVLWYLWFEYAIPKALKKYKADIFLSPDGFLSLKTKVKTITVIHDIAVFHFPEQIPYFARKYYTHFLPKYAQKADKILTVSQYSKEDIANKLKVPPEKITVTYNGCRTVFKPLTIAEKKSVRQRFSEGKPYFFYVGAVHPRKNVHFLIQAFDAFKEKTNSDFKLLIGGSFSWQTGEVTTAYNRAKHKEAIKFLGYLTDADLPELMGAAFALTYVSTFEGFGVPILEALNCDVPVITSDVSSMPEVAGDAGILVNPHDVGTITTAMLDLWKNKDKYHQMVENGRIQKQKFTWTQAAATLWEAIEEVAGEK